MSPEYFKALSRPRNLLFLRIAASGKATGSKLANTEDEILLASMTDANSLESPSFAVKMYPCPPMVAYEIASGI